MVVVNKENDPGAKKDVIAENQNIEAKKRDVTNAVISTLTLPLTDKEKGKKPVAEPAKEGEKTNEEILAADDKTLTEVELKRKKTLEAAPAVEEFESEKTDEEILKADDKDLTEKERAYKKQLEADKGDDELVPKSKLEKIVAKMQKRIDDLTAKSHKEEPAASADSDKTKLNKMSLEKLNTHKQAVKAELRDLSRKLSKGEEVDEKRMDDLEILSDKVDEAITTFATRFRTKQVELYNEVAAEVSEDPEIENLEEATPEIRELAQTIYAKYPKLQKSEEGQALALRLAVDHWKIKKSFSVGKKRVDGLGRTIKRLKRKTALDSNVLKGQKGKTNLIELRKRAGKGGTDETRKEFVKQDGMFNVDALIPDEFKE